MMPSRKPSGSVSLPRRAIRAAVAIVFLPALMLSGAGCGGGDDGRPLSLIVISIDTMRPSRLGCYGNDAIETPHIDQLAARGARFTNCMASAPLTLPSHASILTGQYPFRHRVRNNGRYVLGDERESIAEILKHKGYETAAFVGAFPLAAKFGLSQGFDRYDDEFQEAINKVQEYEERSADRVVDAALAWLDEKGEEDMFLFVHFFDPHFRYEPPEPFLTKYASNPYDGEVAFVDQEIGRLLAALREKGIDRRALIVLTGDHGESFGEHGEMSHAIFVYDATIRVPLVLLWPDRVSESIPWARGSVVDDLVRTIDIAPTALALLEAPPLAEAQGVNLSRPGALGTIENAYSESFASKEDYGWSPLRSIRTPEWKYVMAPRPELYDLVNDPGETVNRIDEETAIAERLASELQAWVTEDKSRGTNEAKPLDDETRAKLEALGYATRGGNPRVSEAALPDPKDRIGIADEVYDAEGLSTAGRYDEAIAMLEDILARDASNHRAWKLLGDAYMQVGDLASARKALDKGLETEPDNPFLLISDAHFYSLSGDYDTSNEILRAVIAMHPKHEGVHGLIAENYMAVEDWEGAIREAVMETEKNPASVSSWNSLGAVYSLSGDQDRAIETFRHAIEVDPTDARSHFNLGNVHMDRGESDRAIASYQEALRVDPGFVEAYQNWSYIEAEAGRMEKAVTLLQKAIRVDPTYSNSYLLLGNLSRKARAYDAAIKHYRTGLHYDPRNQDLLLGLGTALANTGRLEEAIPAWQEAIAIAPGTQAARAAAANMATARASMGR